MKFFVVVNMDKLFYILVSIYDVYLFFLFYINFFEYEIYDRENIFFF